MFDVLLLGGVFISLLAGQFARIELINALANVYVHEFFLIIFIIKSLFQFGLSPIRTLFKSRKVAVFFLICTASFLIAIPEFNVLQNSIALLYGIRVILYSLFAVYLMKLMRSKKNIRLFLHKMLFVFSILLLITTALQFIFFPNFWWLYAFGWDPHLYRASAIYLDVFVAAAVYGLLAFFWFTKGKRVLALLFVIALVLSFSRSAYIAFAISGAYLFISQKKWKELGVALLLFILCIIAVPKPFGEGGNLLRTSSIHSRILDYQLGLTIWQKKPLLGFGYNRIRFAKEHLNLAPQDDRSHSLASFHSSFLIILVTTGMVGFISFILLMGAFLRKFPSMQVYLLYILTMSLFDNVLLHILVLLPLLFIFTQSSLE